jgi:hypothetical protein
LEAQAVKFLFAHQIGQRLASRSTRQKDSPEGGQWGRDFIIGVCNHPGAIFLQSDWRLHPARAEQLNLPGIQAQQQQAIDDDAPLASLAPGALATPAAPSAEEFRNHQLTHLPFASWCPHCVPGKAKMCSIDAFGFRRMIM